MISGKSSILGGNIQNGNVLRLLSAMIFNRIMNCQAVIGFIHDDNLGAHGLGLPLSSDSATGQVLHPGRGLAKLSVQGPVPPCILVYSFFQSTACKCLREASQMAFFPPADVPSPAPQLLA